MRSRIKWILAGVGCTLGLHVGISLLFASFQETSAIITLIAFGMTLGAFMVGGFVVGWISADLRLLDSLVVALATLGLTAGLYAALPEQGHARFVTGGFLAEATVWQGILLVLLSLTAAEAGAYIGWRVRVPVEGVLDRIALIAGLMGAVVGPFILLSVGGRDPSRPGQAGLPWHFLLVVLLLVLAIIGVGFLMFMRESRAADEISISPERRRDF